jgi:hypothetical protein
VLQARKEVVIRICIGHEEGRIIPSAVMIGTYNVNGSYVMIRHKLRPPIIMMHAGYRIMGRTIVLAPLGIYMSGSESFAISVSVACFTSDLL